MRLAAVEEHGTGPAPASSASGVTPRDPWIESQPLAALPAGSSTGAPVALPMSDSAVSYDAIRVRHRVAAGRPPAHLWAAPGTVIQLNQNTEVNSNANLSVAQMQQVESSASVAVLAAQTHLNLVTSEANAHVTRAAQGEHHARDVAEHVIAAANQRINATEAAANEYAVACANEHRARTEVVEQQAAEQYARAEARLYGQLQELEQRLS